MKSRLCCLLIIVTLCLAGAAHAKSPQRGLAVTLNTQVAGSWGDYHALIIGINQYKEWPRLQTAVKDATVIRDTLVTRYGFAEKNVILRTDKAANRLQIIRDLRYMAQSMRPDDNLLIYYAGHGQLDDLTGDGFWVPAEGAMKDPGTWVANSYIKAVLSSEKVLAKNVVVIADSCYSGSMMRGGPSLMSMDDQRYREKLAEKASLRSRQVISSGGVEPVADGGAEGHSLFAYYLINALRKNDREVIDLENLFHTKVWKPVTEIGDQRPNVGRLKTPMDQDGQFVLYNAVWAREQQARRVALVAEQQKQAAKEAQAQKARQQAAVASAELELQRQRFEMEKQKLALEREQLAHERALQKQKAELTKQKQEDVYAKLQARLEALEQQKNTNTAVKPAAAPPQSSAGGPLVAAVTRARQPGYTGRRLALFPIKLISEWGGGEVKYQRDVIRAIDELSMDNPQLEFSLVYKRVTGEPENAAVFSDKVAIESEKVWVKPSLFSSYEPDWEKLKTLGSKLDADLAILVSLNLQGNSTLDIFLYDLRSGKQYALKERSINYYSVMGDVRSFADDLLKAYFREQ